MTQVMSPNSLSEVPNKTLSTFTHLLPRETIHTNQRNLPRYWQWYENHRQQVLGGRERKLIQCWNFVTTVITPCEDFGPQPWFLAVLVPYWSLTDPYPYDLLISWFIYYHFTYYLIKLWHILNFSQGYLCCYQLSGYLPVESHLLSSNNTLYTTNRVVSLWYVNLVLVPGINPNLFSIMSFFLLEHYSLNGSFVTSDYNQTIYLPWYNDNSYKKNLNSEHVRVLVKVQSSQVLILRPLIHNHKEDDYWS